MKPVILAAMLIYTCGTLPAMAGAWLKEKGAGFSSLSIGANSADEQTLALYFEYGLTDKTTVGLDISAFAGQPDMLNGYGAVFLRRSLFASDGPHKFAYEFGFGALYQDDLPLPVVKAGLSWGRGFSHGRGNGWMNVDAAYIYEPTQGQKFAKLDGTLGMDFNDIMTGMIEVHISRSDDDTFGSLEPSLLLRPRKGAFNIKIGAEIPHDDIDRSALKLGVWHRF